MAGHLHNLHKLLLGDDHACPRWLCFTFDNPIRRLLQNPTRIVGPYVSSGDRALDLGPGTGYFTIPLARLVGPEGEVVAADIQEAMLNAVVKRADRKGLTNVRPYLIPDEGLGTDDRFDFVLLFWMLHEVRNRDELLRDVAEMLTEEGRALVVEPKGHVGQALFDAELEAAMAAGFEVVDRPGVALSRAAVLRRRPRAA